MVFYNVRIPLHPPPTSLPRRDGGIETPKQSPTHPLSKDDGVGGIKFMVDLLLGKETGEL